ncbi:hypothetical protein [Cupriavidus gilardii]|uniref:hypothetical protein n=1 Tax=Cupriavidus gilardii TaxID=82541 RepID=UPI001573CF49|nr:hypothetical protein [Cupriavidus gilardii]NSX03862.1 hypothetical protein [Cupriavidus gilardii]
MPSLHGTGTTASTAVRSHAYPPDTRLPSIMRAPLTIHRFAGIHDVRQAVHRHPGELLQTLHRDSSHHIVQLGRNRYRFELCQHKAPQMEGILVEVPFRQMTWRQQLFAIVRTFRSVLPCGSVRSARIRYSLGHFRQREGKDGLVPERGFLPGDSRLSWLYELCRGFRASGEPKLDIPASLDFRDAVVWNEYLDLLQEQLGALPEALRLDQLELILEPLCSLALAPGTEERKKRDELVASLCDRFAKSHDFDMAKAKRIVQLIAGLPAGPAFQHWLESGATRLADGLVAAVSPEGMKPPVTPLPDVDPTTASGFMLVTRHLGDLAAVLPGLPPAAVGKVLRYMGHIAALSGGERVNRIELQTIVARAQARATRTGPGGTDATAPPHRSARVWGKRSDMQADAHR